MSDLETVPVAITLLGTEPVRDAGKLIALAIVEIDISGVVLTLQGVQVLRERTGALSVRAPQFRSADGQWRSSIVLPDSLRDALGAEVLDALQRQDLPTYQPKAAPPQAARILAARGKLRAIAEG